MEKHEGLFYSVRDLLDQDYRGVNIAVYALASAGLAASIYKIRPVSKFSKASKIPEHFLRRHEPLRGVHVGVQHSPVRLLVDHRAPIYLPLWHSSKPPLPVKIWGVEVASGNAVNWLECVAKGKEVTLKPIARENDDLVSTVLLHIPKPEGKTFETLDVGQKLVELGFAKTTVPLHVEKNTIESRLAPVLLSAEFHARNYRNGIWSEQLPPLPIYVIAWRKGNLPKNSHDCGCISKCESDSFHKEYENFVSETSMNRLRIGISSFPKVRVVRETIFELHDAILKVGGVINLCTGASVISLIELVVIILRIPMHYIYKIYKEKLLISRRT